MIISLAGCAKQPKTYFDYNVDLPAFSKKLLQLADGCKCSVEDSKAIVCDCFQPDKDKDIRFRCHHAPVDLYDATLNCYGATIGKEKTVRE